ncbi:MAG: aminotransferase class I/II-fold pyridoxal phosphate-dependent enzyme, partial [Rhodospirillaceae bacterium]|nr:aminotransferase class I/II-fold pyridoxal phosphate-dependent enzyme [Rhodospirillaceae bacterium]
DLSNDLFGMVTAEDYCGDDGTDYRNYGAQSGIPEAKALFAEWLGVPTANIFIGGNSSLQLMYDALSRAMLFGVPSGASGGNTPWRDVEDISFICPIPGYDRHFAVCETLGIRMITVDMQDDGPDMDAVEALVADNPAIKGIWCVPKYSNPSGIVYSAEVTKRLAEMKTAAPDFRIMWDNAYAAHNFAGELAQIDNIFDVAAQAGHPDRPLLFASTSKVTLPGAGIAVVASSTANMADILHHTSMATIGHDKLNQLRHVRFFGDVAGLHQHMDNHGELLRPKFAAVTGALEAAFAGKDFAQWNAPQGGYFVSVDLSDGCATETVRLASEAGLKLTPAGSCHPYGDDPQDRTLRLAPTFPTLDEVKQAMEIFCVSAELACTRKRLAEL